MKRLIIYAGLFLLIQSVNAQGDTLFLRNLLVAAKEYSTSTNRIKISGEISEIKVENTKVGNLPSLSAYGKAWYQSDAITVIAPGGTGLEIDQFQYNAGVEAMQKLFDGGMVKRSREMELAGAKVETDKLEIELYHINNQVVELFYQLEFLEKNMRILQLKVEVLDKKLIELKVAYNNGMIKRNELEKFQAEKLLVDQEMVNIQNLRIQTLLQLNELTGLTIDPLAKLMVSDSLIVANPSIRPELRYFESESMRLESLANLQQGQNLPKLYAFGQLGYSYPGLNFFENQSDYYYIVGAKLSWTLFDWSKNKRQTQVIRRQKDIVNTQRTEFERKLETSMNHELIEQQKLKQMIEMDADIIKQRKLITKGSENALKSGAITTSDYLDDLNSELKARLDQELHSLQLESSFVRLKLLKGINISSLNQ